MVTLSAFRRGSYGGIKMEIFFGKTRWSSPDLNNLGQEGAWRVKSAELVNSANQMTIVYCLIQEISECYRTGVNHYIFLARGNVLGSLHPIGDGGIEGKEATV